MKIAEKRLSSVAGRSIQLLKRRAVDRVVLANLARVPGKAPRKRFLVKTMVLPPEERKLDAELEALDLRLSRLREKVEMLKMRIRDREVRGN